ncbi:MAG TPA: nuclease-related domain-containing protein [Roseiflexaceae bacterium]|nr:nuclease-related domain-containing protein [Roseiflexaceae bacterium]
MAVQVWIGEKPEHSNERRAIVALANGLERLDGLYLILANFSVGGRNIDLVIVKQDAIFIIELKHCDGKIFGDVNGPWFVEGANGERKRLNPGRKNPYNQVISYYYSLINFLNDRRAELLSPQRAASVDFRTCRRVVVISPSIQEGSHVETDWKVELKGLDELPAYLVTERSSEIDLDEQEMLAIPRLLHLTRWTEINALLAGVLPRLDALPEAPPVAAPQPAPSGQEAGDGTTTSPPEVAGLGSQAAGRGPQHSGLSTRLTRLLSTWTGRATVVLSVLVLALVLALLNRPAPPLPAADQPAPPILVSTSPPAGGPEVPAGTIEGETCVWSGFQAVGRRRGAQPGIWENVGVSGAAPALAPDVVVTLEEVSFCDGQIVLSWSVRNNMEDASVTMPLTAENISVRDSLGNEYAIADARSRPAQIVVEPRSRARGTAVVERPVHQSAATLLVQLRSEPFGEATWLVHVDAGR